MKRYCTIVFFLLLGLLSVLRALAEYDYVFEHLSTEDGLSNGSVSAMLKDSRGFMWFATWDGLNRYDGHSFRVFKPGDSENARSASNRIERIAEDRLGNIWVLTYDARAFRLDRRTEQFMAIPAFSEDGPPAHVVEIYPFSNGDVWVATSNTGAYQVKTNPNTFQVETSRFDSSSSVPVPGNSVRFVAEDASHRFWINTDNGLCCLEEDSVSGKIRPVSWSESAQNILAQYRISSFLDRGNRLYLGTAGGKILIFDLSNKTFQVRDLGVRSAVSQIIGAPNGMLYAGTRGDGIVAWHEWDNKVIASYNRPEIAEVLKMYPDSRGLLWIESSKAGISKLDPRNGSYRHYQQQLDVNPDIRSGAQCGIMEDEDHTLWLTLKGGGFGRYNPSTDEIEYFFNQPGQPGSKISNFVNCFYKDSSGVLWLSTYFKGIEKTTFIQKRFRFIQPNPESNLSIANEVRALFEDRQGNLWVATKKQELFILDQDFRILKKIDRLNGQPIGLVYAILENSMGEIFIGTKGNGLYQLTRKRGFDFSVTHYVHNPLDTTSISNDNIYSILEDRKGRIWVGTYGGGLNLFNRGEFISCNHLLCHYPLKKASKIRHLTEDRQGQIWMATTDGLVVLNAEAGFPSDFRFTLFNYDSGNIEGLSGIDIFWIGHQRNGTLWFAALGGGLCRIDRDPGQTFRLSCEALTKKDGLPGDVLYTIIEDSGGRLWMSTENGISSYDPERHLIRNYGFYDGVNQTGFSEAAVAQRQDGTLCFGANNGIYCFNPSDFTNEYQPVRLVFTGFHLFGKEVLPGEQSVLKVAMPETQTIELKYNQNVFGLTWAGLDFKMQDKLTYAYKLGGYDNDWQLARESHYAGYSKLPPGKYTFLLKLREVGQQENNPPVSISIIIHPPFWKTTWAYLAYLLLTILAIELTRNTVTTMIRLRNKVHIEKELTDIKLNFFTNVSHEFRTPLTLILGPAHELRSKETLSDRGENYARLIEQNAKRLLRLVNQLLDFRKIQSQKLVLNYDKVEVVPFVRTVCSNFDEMAREKNIRFTVSCSNPDCSAWFDREKIDQVLFNLLSNAFKFTPDAGAIEVRILDSFSDSVLTIEIADSGVGITKDQEATLFELFTSHRPNGYQVPGTGIGLSFSKQLIELHQGKLTYRPTPGGGATFCFSLKTDQAFSSEAVAQELPEPVQEESGPFLDKKIAVSQQFENQNSSNLPRLLIVEDNHELVSFLQTILCSFYQVESAADGIEGWEKAVRFQPDIILSDVMMPEVDGIELLDRIKNNFETSHIPVVLLSAKSSVESQIEGLKYGADAYLTKPFHPEQLLVQLENILKQRVLLRECYTRPSVEKEVQECQLVLTEPDEQFLLGVRAIIEDNLVRTDFKIETLYKEMGMGRSKFFDKLKGLSGLSPIDYVREYRLSQAKSLLESGTYNVTEVSYLSGFADAGYFSKCFKERFGLNPSQYVKKI